MKVLFAHYSSSYDISGVSNWLIEFIKYSQDKFEIFVHLRHDDGPMSESTFAKWLDDLNINYRIVPKQEDIQSDVELLLESIKKFRPDVFLPQCVHSNFLAGVICGKNGLPWIMTMRSDGEDYWSFYREFDPAMYHGTTVSVSKYIGEEATKFSKQSTPILIPSGVRKTDIKVSWSDSVFRVVYSGRLEIQPKRADLIVDIMIELCQKFPQIECVLIGDGPYKQIAKRKIDEAGLSDKFSITGHISRQNVLEYLSESHVFLMMSEYEGLPTSMVEAMECGVVPVARLTPSGISELVIDSHNGYLTGTDIQDVFNKVSILTQNKDIWESMSQACIKTIDPNYLQIPNFNKWETLIKSLGSCNPATVSFESITTKDFVIPKSILEWNRVQTESLSSRLLRKFRSFLSRRSS